MNLNCVSENENSVGFSTTEKGAHGHLKSITNNTHFSCGLENFYIQELF